MSDPHVIINGKTFLERTKAPFAPSGVSYLGAIEYDREEDRLRCHECGAWFKALGPHLFQAHGMTAREYKYKHGLRVSTSLVNEKLRASRITRGLSAAQTDKFRLNALSGISRGSSPRRATMGSRNLRGTCPAQVLFRIQQIASILGRTPTVADLRNHGLSETSVTIVLNLDSIKEAISLAGLDPIIKGGNGKAYTPKIIIELLRDFYVKHERTPSASDFRRGILPSQAVLRRHFGSSAEAYIAAGIPVSGCALGAARNLGRSVPLYGSAYTRFRTDRGKWIGVVRFNEKSYGTGGYDNRDEALIAARQLLAAKHATLEAAQ